MHTPYYDWALEIATPLVTQRFNKGDIIQHEMSKKKYKIIDYIVDYFAGGYYETVAVDDLTPLDILALFEDNYHLVGSPPPKAIPECQCGAAHTSFPQHHLDYCKLYTKGKL